MSHDKHYAGRFIAEVVSVDDPEKRCRIKVNVYDIFDGVPVRDLPWAVFSLPLGSRAGEGMLCPVRVGDMVWVEFIGGDTRRPVVVGGAHASPGGVPTLPPEIFQGAGQFEHKRCALIALFGHALDTDAVERRIRGFGRGKERRHNQADDNDDNTSC